MKIKSRKKEFALVYCSRGVKFGMAGVSRNEAWHGGHGRKLPHCILTMYRKQRESKREKMVWGNEREKEK